METQTQLLIWFVSGLCIGAMLALVCVIVIGMYGDRQIKRRKAAERAEKHKAAVDAYQMGLDAGRATNRAIEDDTARLRGFFEGVAGKTDKG